jgi:hypothetical protein
MSVYFVKMKGLADDMASVGKKLEDDEDYESIVTAMMSRVEPISVNELYAQLMAFEQRRDLHGGGS